MTNPDRSSHTDISADVVSRKLYVAWSRLQGADEHAPRECGLIRITDAAARFTLFTYLRNGHMTDAEGNEFNVDVMDSQARWISDTPVEIAGIKSTGSRWTVPADNSYLFIGWQHNADGEIEAAGFVAITNAAFSEFEDRWDVTISRPAGAR